MVAISRHELAHVAAALCILQWAFPTSVASQERPPSRGSVTSPRDSGATLDVTRAWLQQELPRISSFGYSQQSGGEVIATYNRSVRSAILSGCNLIIDVAYKSIPRSDVPLEWTTRIPLKDIDLGILAVLENTAGPGVEYVPAIFNIPIRAVPGRGDPFQEVSAGRTMATDRTVIAVGDRTQGERVVRALRRAAVLCGAVVPPF
jgi:hypothetical protein